MFTNTARLRLRVGTLVPSSILTNASALLAQAGSAPADGTSQQAFEDLALAEPLPGGTWIVLAGLAVLLVGTWLSRSYGLGGSGPRASLRMLGSLPLGDKRAIALVEAEDQKMLVGITSQSVNLLCQLPPSEDPLPGASEAEDTEGNQNSPPAVSRSGFVAVLKGAFQRQERSQ